MTHVLFFEPSASGHRASYFETLTRQLARPGQELRATFAIPAELVDRLSPEARALLAEEQPAQLRLRKLRRWETSLHRFDSAAHNAEKLLFASSERPRLRAAIEHALSVMNRLPGGVSHWNIGLSDVRYFLVFEHLLRETGADHGFTFQLSRMATGLRHFGTRLGGAPISGLVANPTLHYPSLRSAPHQPHELAEARYQDRAFRQLLRHPRIARALVLDQYFAEAAAATSEWAEKIVFLPDMAPEVPAGGSLPADLPAGLDDGRILFLLFGSLSRRKGLATTLAAIERLGPRALERSAFLFAGPVRNVERPRFVRRLRRAQARPMSWLHLLDRFLPETELGALIARADVVLAPYLRWRNSSGVLYWAARAGKPVITQDYGLVATQARDYGLGCTVDTRDPRALADAIEGIILAGEPGLARLADEAGQARFCDGNSAQTFASTIVRALGSSA